MTTFLHYGALETAPLLATDQAPVIWVPGEAVVCHQLTVPPVNRKKWQAMIPWLLEEHLLEPPETLAFSTGGKNRDNSVAVLAVNKKLLATWQQVLQDRGQQYSALVPDFFALPWSEDHLALGVVKDRCLVRFNQWQGAAGAPAFILPLVQMALKKRPARVTVYYQGEKPALGAVETDGWSFEPVTNIFAPTHADWLSIAAGQVTRKAVNWPWPAKVAAVLVLVLTGLLASMMAVENRQMIAQVDQLQDALRRGYRQYFGEAYDFAMTDFQRVVSSRLEAAAGNSAAGSLAMVEQLAAWLQGCPACRLEKLQIASGEMRVDLSGEGIQAHFAALAAGDNRLSLQQQDAGWRLTYAVEADAHE